ncbi:MAG: DUF2800 domain-containing protein [Oscillospiraceae bacterium]|nr:DUF2800 domain-containing protein [Oscillospiraceae bacterium]
MPDKHAILSASSSHRWLNCPPSALLNAKAEDSVSDYALQGTDAHTLCEFKLRSALDMNARDPTENLTYYDEEMETCAVDYADYVVQTVEILKQSCSYPLVLVEQRLDFSDYVPDGFGTGDCVIVTDGRLTIIDFKYGTGVLVEAERNSQMMLYALGALQMFDDLYDISEIQMTIFQPRRSNVSTYTIRKADLLDWANDTLKPIAALAAKGEGEFTAGEHCRFCKVKATCRKRAECNMALAKYDFTEATSLTDVEIEDILDKADELVSWVSDIKDYALEQALLGKEWQRYKAVEGRSNRKYTNDECVASVVSAAGYDPYERKVLGIAAMTKLLGKKKFDELLGGYIEKPQGKPTLVKMSDKRPALNTAKNDFKDLD